MSRYIESEDVIIRENYGKHPVREWLSLLQNRTIDSVITRANRLGLSSGILGNQVTTGNYVKPKFTPELPNMNDLTFDELWEAAYAFQGASKSLSTRYDEVDVEIAVNHPIAICFIADTHIGNIDVPLDYVRSRFDLLEQYPFVYVAGCGDMIDNYLPTSHVEGMFGQLFPPELQKELVENLYSKLKGRWLWVIQGCHDDFSHKADDFDLAKHMGKYLGCANLGHGGMVNLLVGKQNYKIAVRHKYRFNSSYNPTHSPKQLVRFDYKNADIAVVAHNHVTAIEHSAEPDKDRIYIRPGSMKGPDRYARSLGFRDTGRQMPTVILWPDKRKMLAFMDLEQALEIFKNLTVQ
jgi:hypothetical protein